MSERIVGWLLKLIAGLLASGGALELHSGKIFGKIIFFVFDYVTVPNIAFNPIHQLNQVDGLYRTWGGQIAADFLPHLFSAKALLALVLVLLVTSHVIFKAHLEKARASVQKYVLPVRLYLRYYFRITLVVFLGLTLSLFGVPTRFWLITCFLLMLLPSTIYLVLYSKDIMRGRFYERYAYVGMLLLLVVALVGLPANYGRKFFDVQLRPIEGMEGTVDSTVGLGPFLFDDNHAGSDQLICKILCSEGRLTLQLSKLPERLRGGIAWDHEQPLRELAVEMAKCEGLTPAPGQPQEMPEEILESALGDL